MEKITVKSAYNMFNQLIVNGANVNKIANLALDCMNLWDSNNAKEAYYIVYDLALLEEEGMELSYYDICKLIHNLKYYM